MPGTNGGRPDTGAALLGKRPACEDRARVVFAVSIKWNCRWMAASAMDIPRSSVAEQYALLAGKVPAGTVLRVAAARGDKGGKGGVLFSAVALFRGRLVTCGEIQAWLCLPSLFEVITEPCEYNRRPTPSLEDWLSMEWQLLFDGNVSEGNELREAGLGDSRTMRWLEHLAEQERVAGSDEDVERMTQVMREFQREAREGDMVCTSPVAGVDVRGISREYHGDGS